MNSYLYPIEVSKTLESIDSISDIDQFAFINEQSGECEEEVDAQKTHKVRASSIGHIFNYYSKAKMNCQKQTEVSSEKWTTQGEKDSQATTEK